MRCSLLAAGGRALGGTQDSHQWLASANGSQVPMGLLFFLLGPQPSCFFLQCVMLPPTTWVHFLWEEPRLPTPARDPFFCAALWRRPVCHYERPSLETDEKSFLKEGYQVREMSKLRRALFKNTLGPISIVLYHIPFAQTVSAVPMMDGAAVQQPVCQPFPPPSLCT